MRTLWISRVFCMVKCHWQTNVYLFIAAYILLVNMHAYRGLPTAEFICDDYFELRICFSSRGCVSSSNVLTMVSIFCHQASLIFPLDRPFYRSVNITMLPPPLFLISPLALLYRFCLSLYSFCSLASQKRFYLASGVYWICFHGFTTSLTNALHGAFMSRAVKILRAL